jgi:hypothetical protein
MLSVRIRSVASPVARGGRRGRAECSLSPFLSVPPCSSTHKASLAMVLYRILQWWRLGVSPGVHIEGAGVGRRPLSTVVVETLGFVLYFSIS